MPIIALILTCQCNFFMNILSEFARGLWFIDPAFANQYFLMAHKIMSGDMMYQDSEINPLANIPSLNNTCSNGQNLVSAYDVFVEPELIKQSSLFLLNLSGAITKYDQFCGPSGTKTKSLWIKQADKHPNVFAHLIAVDSGGGSGYAANQFSETLKSLTKPVFCFVEGHAASAAYWIAANCQHIAAGSQMDAVGSIGSYITIADYSKWYLDQGIRLIEVYASQSTDKNRDYLEAIQGNLAKLQEVSDKYCEFILDTVKENRLDAAKHYQHWATGKMFFAPQAKEIGLIDAITPIDKYIESIFTIL